MGKFFSSLLSLFLRLKASPVVAAIGAVVVETLSQIPKEVPPRVLSLVAEASARDEDNRAKFIWVLNRVRTEFPNLQENMIRTLIESTLMLHKKETNV